MGSPSITVNEKLNIECIILSTQKIDEVAQVLWLQPLERNCPPFPIPVYGAGREFRAGEHYQLDLARLISEFLTTIYIAREHVQMEALR